MKPESLAHKLGTTTHISPLLMKARRLGLRGAEDLCTLAVQRGCRHYCQGTEPEGELLAESQFSNEELALGYHSVPEAIGQSLDMDVILRFSCAAEVDAEISHLMEIVAAR